MVHLVSTKNRRDQNSLVLLKSAEILSDAVSASDANVRCDRFQ